MAQSLARRRDARWRSGRRSRGHLAKPGSPARATASPIPSVMTGIDSRAWLVWAVAAMLPALIGRNPILLAELLGIVVVVHTVCSSAGSFPGIQWFVRIAAVFTLIGVIFNVLTVHAGTSVFASLPERWPVIGGDLTLNALAYGVTSGIALFTLVLIGTTVGSLVNWMDLFHALPSRLAPLAVAGSVAWAILPQTTVAFRQIRESQEMRGHHARGMRGLLPLIVPLLAGSLERALATAEALEARGFGASYGPGGRRRGSRIFVPSLMICAMALLISGAFGALTGYARAGALTIAAGIVLFGLTLRIPDGSQIRRTRYRQPVWTLRDGVVSGSALVAAGSTLRASWSTPDTLRFEPYPDLAVPVVDVPLMLALALLIVPALIVPTFVPQSDPDHAPW